MYVSICSSFIGNHQNPETTQMSFKWWMAEQPWCIHSIERPRATHKNKLLIHAATGTNFKYITHYANEQSQISIYMTLCKRQSYRDEALVVVARVTGQVENMDSKGLTRKQLLCVNGAFLYPDCGGGYTGLCQISKTVHERGYCNVCLLKRHLQKSCLVCSACFPLFSHGKETPPRLNMWLMSRAGPCGSESVVLHPSPPSRHSAMEACRWLALFVSSLPLPELRSPLGKKAGPGTHRREMGA